MFRPTAASLQGKVPDQYKLLSRLRRGPIPHKQETRGYPESRSQTLLTSSALRDPRGRACLLPSAGPVRQPFGVLAALSQCRTLLILVELRWRATATEAVFKPVMRQ